MKNASTFEYLISQFYEHKTLKGGGGTVREWAIIRDNTVSGICAIVINITI